MSVERIKFFDIDAARLCIDRYEVTILYGRGCNIIDFKVKTEDEVHSIFHIPAKDDLEEFTKSPQRFGSAVLFPPNRIKDGIYTWEGKTYDLCGNGLPFAHGVLKEFAFELIQAIETPRSIYIKCTLDSSATPYFTAFNWDFKVSFEFELSKDGLSQTITIENTGDENIPFGVGYHTAFMFPQNENYSADDYRIQVSSSLQWETGDNLIPTGKLKEQRIPYNEGGIAPLSCILDDHIRAVPSENGFNKAVITNTVNNLQFVYETDPAFCNWMIWNNKASSNYVCIEPMTCIIDAPHSSLEAKEHGFMTLRPGKCWTAQVLFYAV